MEKQLPTEKQESSITPLKQETIELVKRMIFPNASNEELQLFIHKCLTCGVHPLDGMIYPSKYNTKNGSRVVFISSIDFFRSKAEESGAYDGQDEVEYYYEDHEDDFEHPTKAKVNIYKKGISRPFVGVAKWNEFYPSDANKQFMYKKYPETMLGKCAEVQGIRKAFPQKLNKLYIEEEMYKGMNSNTPASKKPSIKIETNDTTNKNAYIQHNNTISEKQSKRLYAICKKSNVDIEQLKLWLKNSIGIEHLSDIQKGDMYDKIVNAVENSSTTINKYKPTSKGEEDPQLNNNESFVMENDIFKLTIREMAEKAGIDTDDKINTELKSLGLKDVNDIENIPDNQQCTIIDYFNFKLEEINNANI